MAFFEDIRDGMAGFVGRLRAGMSQQKFLAVLAIFVGSVAGLAAALLKDLINYTSSMAKALVPDNHYNFALIWLPVIGILLCGIFCRYVVKQNMEFGCEKIANTLKSGNYKMSSKLAWAPMVACSLTIGFGGSAGSEGPIAYTGAGIGSNVGKLFKLDSECMRLLVIIGAAAGIAGIFKAPIGGVMFALEVLAMPMTTVSVIALVFACLAAACVAYACSGFTIDISYMPTNFFDPGMTAGVVALGIFCGLYSIYYSHMMRLTTGWYERMRNPWIKNIVSGLFVGLLIFIFPVLWGEGYGTLGDIINGNNSTVMRDTALFGLHGPWLLLAFVALTFLLKPFATGTTNSGGGVGGDFAPTLFAGCMGGLVFAYFSNTYLGTHLNVANFALFGMAGVMAGAIQAPLMAIFLSLEMVGDFAMFFPLSICALISFAFVRLTHRHLRINFHPVWLHHHPSAKPLSSQDV